MQIKLQSDNYHVLLNTLGAELNSIPIHPGMNTYGILIPLTGFDLLRFFFRPWEMSATEKLLSRIIYTRCPNMVFVKNLNLK